MTEGKNKLTHLWYGYQEAWDSGEERHAQQVVNEMKILFSHMTGHPIGDCVYFHNVVVPKGTELPEYMKIKDLCPTNECKGCSCGNKEK